MCPLEVDRHILKCYGCQDLDSTLNINQNLLSVSIIEIKRSIFDSRFFCTSNGEKTTLSHFNCNTASLPAACSCTFRHLFCVRRKTCQRCWVNIFFRDTSLICLGRGFTCDRFEKLNFVTKTCEFLSFVVYCWLFKGCFFFVKHGKFYLNLSNSNLQIAPG